jgi:Tol biopolymer transport system component
MAMYWPLPSLDGKRLFIAGYQPRNEFLRYDLQSRQFVPTLAGLSGTELEFSKDGKWVAYVSIPDGSLFRAAADGSQRLQITSVPFVAMPHWSPDGTQIAFTAGNPTRIYVAPFDGGAVRRVTNGESGKNGDMDPSWSPDGASLAFGAHYSIDAAVEESIHVVDLKTEHVSTLAGSERMWAPRWSPDGRLIAGLSLRRQKLMLYDLRTRKQTVLFEQDSGWPSWSWDGKFLFFASDSNRWISRVRMRDGEVERVTNLSKGRAHNTEWFAAAPDNSLITARDAGTDEIYALNWDAP